MSKNNNGDEFKTTAVVSAVAGNYDDPEAVKVVEYVNDRKISIMNFHEDAALDFAIAKDKLVDKHKELDTVYTTYIPPIENKRLRTFNEHQQSIWDKQMKFYEKKLGTEAYTLLPASEYTTEDSRENLRTRRISRAKHVPEF